ncbi:hypothetical protein HZF24_17950 [Sedimentibacter hydroxybenzoicus DSM 7310]|uniref:Uncharacterized protein n=1 Tax=Sedimentibacter hydroxybenzoicus DSM 7310 TaxID=1123245 RepID=A0A974BMB2_SEDHY|nr:hypothetical protein [Sedimentibacter hydroxybenzoicus]NYB76034.1 hypothetical protein [Sedimentibacter hydroxybenzoicus DSM 7310]
MKEIIDQIIEIDSLAFDNKTKNEQLLLKKKQEYEKTIQDYRIEKLNDAKNKAQQLAEETENFIHENELAQESKILKISEEIEKLYKKSEKDLVEKIFNKLFVLEG